MSFDTALLNLVGAGLGVVASRQLAVSDRVARQTDPANLVAFISHAGLGRPLATLAQNVARPLVPRYRADPERVIRHIQQSSILLPDHAFAAGGGTQDAWFQIDSHARPTTGSGVADDESSTQLATACRQLACAIATTPKRAGILAKADLDGELIEDVLTAVLQSLLTDSSAWNAVKPAVERFAHEQMRSRASHTPVNKRRPGQPAGAARAILETLRERIDAMAGHHSVPRPMLSAVATAILAASEREQEVMARLGGKIAEYKELEALLTRPTDFDAAVATLRAQSAAAIQAGRFDLADRLLAQAEDVDLNSAREKVESESLHMLQASESRLLRGSLEALRCNYRAGAAHCGAAASYVPIDDARARWKVLIRQAQLLAREAEEQGDFQALEQAVALQATCLQLRPRHAASKDWAITQHLFGTLHYRLGVHQADTANLHQSAQACRAAADELIGQREPMRWAQALADYAMALHMIGERTHDQAALADAVAAQRETLAVFTRSASPQDWAQAQIGIAGTLLLIATRDGSHHRLTEAIAAYRSALEVIDAEQAPEATIKARIRLAEALCQIARRDGQPRHLIDAENILSALPSDIGNDRRMPFERGRYLAVKGTLELELGRRSRAGDRLLRAIDSLEQALEIFSPTTMPMAYAAAQRDVGVAFEALSQLERYAEPRLNQAVDAYRAAVAVLDRATSPQLWAHVELDLGRALYALGMEVGGERLLSEALAVEQAALEVLQTYGDATLTTFVQDGLAEKAAHLERLRRSAQTRR